MKKRLCYFANYIEIFLYDYLVSKSNEKIQKPDGEINRLV